MNTHLEEEQITTTHTNYTITPFIPIAVALVGIILGATALFISMSGKKEQGHNPELQEQLTHLQTRLSQAEAQLVQLNDIGSQNSDQIKNMGEQVQNALNEVSRSISTMQARTMNPPIPKEKNITSSASMPQGNVSIQNQGTYSVQAGDTLSKIAHKHNTNTQTLLTINPNINPKRLQVGQTIKVPTY